MTEESGNTSKEILSNEEVFGSPESQLRSIERTIAEWAEKYELKLFRETPTLNKLLYLLRNIDHKHQQQEATQALRLKQMEQAANNRTHYLDAQLTKITRELNQLKKKHEYFLLRVQFWIEASGEGLTHREKNEKIRKAVAEMIKIELPPDSDF
jgi:hypothetical protein